MAYLPSFRVPFLMDDQVAFLDNPTLRGGPLTWAAWQPPGDGNTVQGRPVLNASFALSYAIGGPDPAAHRAVNLAIHLANALLLALVLVLAFRSPRWRATFEGTALPLAAISALLWALHPLHTLAVTYVAQRAEALVSFFYLATIAAWLGARHAPRWRGPLLVLSVASCGLGMLAKEVMVTAPVAVLALDCALWPRAAREGGAGERAFRVASVGLACTWGLLLWQLALGGFARGASTGAIGFTRLQYLATQAHAIPLYVTRILLPAAIQFDHGPRIVIDAPSLLRAAPFWIAVAALFAGLAWRRRTDVVVALGLFFLLLAPTSSLVPVATQTIAEHRVYLASSVMIAGVVVLGERLSRGRRLRVAALALAATACALLGAHTWRYNGFLQDPVRLWQDVTERAPGNGRAYGNLAGALLERGADDAALVALDRAIAIEPRNVRSLYNRANALRRKGDLSGAERDYRSALAIDPDHVQARNNLAMLRRRLGDAAEARRELEHLVRLAPGHAPAWLNLASVAFEQRDLAASRDAVERFLALRGDSAKGWRLAADVRRALGDEAGAREAEMRAARLADDAAAGGAAAAGAAAGSDDRGAAPPQRDGPAPSRRPDTE